MNPKESALKLMEAIKLSVVGDVVPPGWHSTAELCESSGMGPAGVRKRIRKALQAGTLEMKDFKVRTGFGIRIIPHYKIKSKQKVKK